MKKWRLLNRRQTIVLSRLDDGSEGELHRWRLIETPLGGIMLHQHHGPDPGRVLHDHPWWFAALILRGGYTEEVAETRYAPAMAMLANEHVGATYGIAREHRAGSWHTVRLEQAHRIVSLRRAPTWTLIVHGPRRRKWGFYPAVGFIDEKRVDWEHLDLIGTAPGIGPLSGVGAGPISLDSGDGGDR